MILTAWPLCQARLGEGGEEETKCCCWALIFSCSGHTHTHTHTIKWHNDFLIICQIAFAWPLNLRYVSLWQMRRQCGGEDGEGKPDCQITYTHTVTHYHTSNMCLKLSVSVSVWLLYIAKRREEEGQRVGETEICKCNLKPLPRSRKDSVAIAIAIDIGSCQAVKADT